MEDIISLYIPSSCDADRLKAELEKKASLEKYSGTLPPIRLVEEIVLSESDLRAIEKIYLRP